MSKVRIDSDEWYPVYSVTESETFGYEVEATPEQTERWMLAFAAFSEAQDEIGELYDAAHEADMARRAKEKADREAAEKAERERVARERDAEARAEQARRDAMWQQIQESGGVVYDAAGNQIGTVEPARSAPMRGLDFRIRPAD